MNTYENCIWCGEECERLDTDICEECSILFTHIEMNVDVAEKMINELKKERRN
jgi:hypothetical protein